MLLFGILDATVEERHVNGLVGHLFDVLVLEIHGAWPKDDIGYLGQLEQMLAQLGDCDVAAPTA